MLSEAQRNLGNNWPLISNLNIHVKVSLLSSGKKWTIQLNTVIVFSQTSLKKSAGAATVQLIQNNIAVLSGSLCSALEKTWSLQPASYLFLVPHTCDEVRVLAWLMEQTHLSFVAPLWAASILCRFFFLPSASSCELCRCGTHPGSLRWHPSLKVLEGFFCEVDSRLMAHLLSLFDERSTDLHRTGFTGATWHSNIAIPVQWRFIVLQIICTLLLVLVC